MRVELNADVDVARAKNGGVKLSDGCVLVPYSVSDETTGMLGSLGVETNKLEIYIGADSFKRARAWQA